MQGFQLLPELGFEALGRLAFAIEPRGVVGGLVGLGVQGGDEGFQLVPGIAEEGPRAVGQLGRHTGALRDLEGVAAARQALAENEGGLQAVRVEGHGAVHHPGMVVREDLQGAVMGGDHEPGSALEQHLHQRPIQGHAFFGVGAGGGFVDQDDGGWWVVDGGWIPTIHDPQSTNHVFHPFQSAGKRGEVVFDGLVVAHVHGQGPEHRKAAPLPRRDGEPALGEEHAQAEGLHGDGFPARIRTRDDQPAFVGFHRQIQGNDGNPPPDPPSLLRMHQHRVARGDEHDPVVGTEGGRDAIPAQADARDGAQAVEFAQQRRVALQRKPVLADHARQDAQQAVDLAHLLGFEGSEVVVDVQGLGRFDVDGLPGGGGVVDEAGQMPFVLGADGEHHASGADGGLVLGEEAVFGGLPRDARERGAEVVAPRQQASADLLQLGRGVVADHPGVGQYGEDLVFHLLQGDERFGPGRQMRGRIRTLHERLPHAPGRGGDMEDPQDGIGIQYRPLRTRPFQGFARIGELGEGQGLPITPHRHQLTGPLQAQGHHLPVGRRGQGVDPFRTDRGCA